MNRVATMKKKLQYNFFHADEICIFVIPDSINNSKYINYIFLHLLFKINLLALLDNLEVSWKEISK
jgi:hypothetical protein